MRRASGHHQAQKSLREHAPGEASDVRMASWCRKPASERGYSERNQPVNQVNRRDALKGVLFGAMASSLSVGLLTRSVEAAPFAFEKDLAAKADDLTEDLAEQVQFGPPRWHGPPVWHQRPRWHRPPHWRGWRWRRAQFGPPFGPPPPWRGRRWVCWWRRGRRVCGWRW